MRSLQERIYADAFLDDLHPHVSANSRAHRITGSAECCTLGNVKLATDRADEIYGRRRIESVRHQRNTRRYQEAKQLLSLTSLTMNNQYVSSKRFPVFAHTSFLFQLHFVCAGLYYVFL